MSWLVRDSIEQLRALSDEYDDEYDEDHDIEAYARFDLSGCPFYRSGGKLPGCRWCHEGPECFDARPVEGWPSEQATESEAYAMSMYDPNEGFIDA